MQSPRTVTRRVSRGGLEPDKYLSEEEIRRLLRCVKAQADLARARGSRRAVLDEAVVLTLMYAGLRPAELCQLDVRDLPAHHGKNVIHVRNGKGGVTRTIEIGPRLCTALKRWVRLYRRRAKPTDPVFLSERRERLTYYSVWWKVRRIGAAAGLPDLYPYRLRHTYATRLYNVEQDLRLVQDQLGHASPQTTAVYAKTDQASRRRQVQAFEETYRENERTAR